MTCVAVMVVPVVIPNTTTESPLAMALAEVALVPSWYVVEDASSTVTAWPADVVTVKPDADTLPTVPDEPPEAGPDRALESPPAAPGPGNPGPAAPAGNPEVAEGDVEVGDEEVEDAAQPAEIPMAATASAAAAIRRPRRFDSHPAPPELPAACSWSFMTTLL
jgi:hypothetical protein